MTLAERGERGRVYNLASGEAFSIGEVLDRLRRISGVTAWVERDEARVRPIDLPLLCGSAGRLRELGLASGAQPGRRSRGPLARGSEVGGPAT